MDRELEKLMERLDFPTEDRGALLKDLQKIERNPEAWAEFQALLRQYEEFPLREEEELQKKMEWISGLCGIHRFSGNMLLMLAMGKTLLRRYREKGYDEAVFWDTMTDLRYKLEECRLIYGISGTFVAEWMWRYFRPDRFCLGRLQFETDPLGLSCVCGGKVLNPETNVIWMHIPRTGTPLSREAVDEACRRAKAFFRDRIGEEAAVFGCYSWLLDPWHLTNLPENSNIRAFCSRFTLAVTGDYDDYEETWRIFDRLYPGSTRTLPADSSLRRAYKRRMEAGEKLGWGKGVFIM